MGNALIDQLIIICKSGDVAPGDTFCKSGDVAPGEGEVSTEVAQQITSIVREIPVDAIHEHCDRELLQYIPYKYQTMEICTKLIEGDPHNIKHVSQRIFSETDKEIMQKLAFDSALNHCINYYGDVPPYAELTEFIRTNIPTRFIQLTPNFIENLKRETDWNENHLIRLIPDELITKELLVTIGRLTPLALMPDNMITQELLIQTGLFS